MSLHRNRNNLSHALKFETMENRILLAADFAEPAPVSDTVERTFYLASDSDVFSIRQLSAPLSDLLEAKTVSAEAPADDAPTQNLTTISILRIGTRLTDFSTDSTFLAYSAISNPITWPTPVDASTTADFSYRIDTFTQHLYQSTDKRDELNSIEFGTVRDRPIARIIEKKQPLNNTNPPERAIIIIDNQSTIDIATITEPVAAGPQATVGLAQSSIGTIQVLTPVARLSDSANVSTLSQTVPSEFGEEIEEVTALENSSTFRSQSFEFSTIQTASTLGNAAETNRPNSESTAPTIQKEKATLELSRRANQHSTRRPPTPSQCAESLDEAHLEALEIAAEDSLANLPSLTDSLDAQLPDDLIEQQFEEMLAEHGIATVQEPRSSESSDDDSEDDHDYARASRRIISPILLVSIPYVIHRRVKS